MSDFTTRVELNGADWEDYTRLHLEMSNEGFTRTIRSDNGTTYEMPPAEYDYRGNATRSDILSKAKSAASRVGRPFSVLVTESAGRTWHNLEVA